jgi:hypothetical protein
MGKSIEEGMKSGVARDRAVPAEREGRARPTLWRRVYSDRRALHGIEGAGFAPIQAKSTEAAIEYTKCFLNVAGDGESEIRQVFEASDFSPESYFPEISARASMARAAAEKARQPVAAGAPPSTSCRVGFPVSTKCSTVEHIFILHSGQTAHTGCPLRL